MLMEDSDLVGSGNLRVRHREILLFGWEVATVDFYFSNIVILIIKVQADCIGLKEISSRHLHLVSDCVRTIEKV